MVTAARDRLARTLRGDTETAVSVRFTARTDDRRALLRPPRNYCLSWVAAAQRTLPSIMLASAR